MNEFYSQVARCLLEIGAVGFSVKKPITFTSGMKSPVYVDNRKLPFHPEQWRVVMRGFEEVAKGLEYEVVASVEAAGIPHGSVLGYVTGKPSVFVRKKPKKHGTRSQIEGGEVAARRVLLVEDLVTTGGSSLKAVEVLRKAGADVAACLVVVSYGFEESKRAFRDAGVTLYSLTDFETILIEAVKGGQISQEEEEMVLEWMRDPWRWGEGK